MPPVRRAHDVLEPGQAVEVEIVGRLVEEGEVEAGEQNGGEGHLGLLARRTSVDTGCCATMSGGSATCAQALTSRASKSPAEIAS